MEDFERTIEITCTKYRSSIVDGKITLLVDDASASGVVGNFWAYELYGLCQQKDKFDDVLLHDVDLKKTLSKIAESGDSDWIFDSLMKGMAESLGHERFLELALEATNPE